MFGRVCLAANTIDLAEVDLVESRIPEPNVRLRVWRRPQVSLPASFVSGYHTVKDDFKPSNVGDLMLRVRFMNWVMISVRVWYRVGCSYGNG